MGIGVAAVGIVVGMLSSGSTITEGAGVSAPGVGAIVGACENAHVSASDISQVGVSSARSSCSLNSAKNSQVRSLCDVCT